MTLDTSSGSNTPSARSGPRRPLSLSRRSSTGRAAAWAEESAGLLPEVLPDGGARRRRLLSLWPLLVVLAVQAGLSLRLLRADTASQSEALYLRAGHLEWANWLHGVPIPPYPKYFSGAPVIYPPIGAVADSIGGLAGARVLSLAFMLGATILLWSTTGRLFGRRASFFASALFALLGTTLHLGAFATYDAMSLFLVALAAWCVIRPGARGPATGWMLAGAGVLALSNVAAYTTLLFDPLIVALALLTSPWTSRGLLAARRAGTVLVGTAALLGLVVAADRSDYLGGFERTMVTRVAGSASAQSVLGQSWYWAGLLLLLAVSAVAISVATRQAAAQSVLLVFLTAALIFGPLEQAHLHTVATLNHHVGLGAWFTAIAAGYAVDRLIAAAPAGQSRTVTCGACVSRAGLPGLPRHRPVPGLLVRLAELVRLPRGLRPDRRPRQRPAPGGRSRGRRVLSARRRPVAEVVQHPQHHPARRNLYRRPGLRRQRHRGRQRSRLRQLHRPRLLLRGRAELHRHDRAGPPDNRGPASQSALPRHPGRPLRDGDAPGRPGQLRHLAISGQHQAVRIHA